LGDRSSIRSNDAATDVRPVLRLQLHCRSPQRADGGDGAATACLHAPAGAAAADDDGDGTAAASLFESVRRPVYARWCRDAAPCQKRIHWNWYDVGRHRTYYSVFGTFGSFPSHCKNDNMSTAIEEFFASFWLFMSKKVDVHLGTELLKD